MSCKGICSRYKAKKDTSGGWYKSNNRCSHCCVFINFKGKYCPCCGFRLRVKPRNKMYKEKLRIAQGIGT